MFLESDCLNQLLLFVFTDCIRTVCLQLDKEPNMLAQAGALVGLIRRGFPLIPLSRRILPTISTKDINGFYSSTGDDHENKSEQLKHLGKKLDDILYGKLNTIKILTSKTEYVILMSVIEVCNRGCNIGNTWM